MNVLFVLKFFFFKNYTMCYDLELENSLFYLDFVKNVIKGYIFTIKNVIINVYKCL